MTIKEELYKPFDQIKSRKGRGGTYDYVSWKDVADRMNEVFGMNWSSNVTSEEKINDQLIIRVNVCAKDPVSNELFCQEGFGGSVMRPSDEAGTAHKGAYSKALKDACKKWGIGLHLTEDNTSSGGGGYKPQTTPSMSVAPQGPPTNTNQGFPSNSSPSMPSGYSGHETAPAPQASSAPPVRQIPPTSSAPVNAPPTQQPSAPQETSPMPPSMSPEVSVDQSIANAGFPPMPPVSQLSTQTPPVDNTSSAAPMEQNTTEAGSINNVQEMAIKNLARLGNFDTPESLIKSLAEDSENEVGRAVTNIRDLSYDEAVMVIKTAKNTQ